MSNQYKQLGSFLKDKMMKDNETLLKIQLSKDTDLNAEYECNNLECTQWYNTKYSPGLYAWSKNFIHFIATWENRYWIDSVPRNPCDCDPKAVGG